MNCTLVGLNLTHAVLESSAIDCVIFANVGISMMVDLNFMLHVIWSGSCCWSD